MTTTSPLYRLMVLLLLTPGGPPLLRPASASSPDPGSVPSTVTLSPAMAAS